MELDAALDLGRHAMLVALVIVTPILLVGLIVGVLISILQAVTQVQEQTLTFVPKIIAMAVAAMVLMPWITVKMLTFAREMLGPMFEP